MVCKGFETEENCDCSESVSCSIYFENNFKSSI